MNKKEELILKVINEGMKNLENTKKDHEEMIENYKNNGFGNMHPNNIESYRTGLHYTHGYCIGHLELLKNINSLISMTSKEIKELIIENERISEENAKHIKEVMQHNKKILRKKY